MKKVMINICGILLLVACNYTPQKTGANSANNETTIQAIEVRDVADSKAEAKRRNEDIKMLREYINKSQKSLTDENGFPLNYDYSYTIKILQDLGKTETVANKGSYRNALYLNLLKAEATFALILNGKQEKEIKLAVQIYDRYELNPLSSNPIPKKFTKQRELFLPELEEIAVRKEIITKITKSNFSQAFFEQNTNDKTMNTKWLNTSSNFIKDSGILSFESL